MPTGTVEDTVPLLVQLHPASTPLHLDDVMATLATRHVDTNLPGFVADVTVAMNMTVVTGAVRIVSGRFSNEAVRFLVHGFQARAASSVGSLGAANECDQPWRCVNLRTSCCVGAAASGSRGAGRPRNACHCDVVVGVGPGGPALAAPRRPVLL